jgi:hypothetical protein
MTTEDTTERLTPQEESTLDRAVYDAEKAVDSMKSALGNGSFNWVTRAEAAEYAAELQDEAESLCDAMNTLIATVAELAAEAVD